MSLNPTADKYDRIYDKIRAYQETESNDIAEELLLHYEPMVRMAAGKMSRSRNDLFEDLFQVGQMSLLRLLRQYDFGMDTPFEAYMMKSIIGHMKNYLRDKSWYIQVPRRIKEKSLHLQQAIDQLTVQLERSPNVDEIAQHTQLSAEEVIEILAGRECYHYVSLDTPVSAEENGATIGDMIGTSGDEYGQLENRIDLQEAFTHLKPEERTVLELVYQKGESQRSIAQLLGVSQMSVSRIQKRALDKLRQVLDNLDP